MTGCTARALKWIKKALRMGWSKAAIGRSMKVDQMTVTNWVRRFVEVK
jgi:hypothetical protein